MHVYRFLLRLWCTRHAKSVSFGHRCRTIWGTCWMDCTSYNLLRYLIEHEKPRRQRIKTNMTKDKVVKIAEAVSMNFAHRSYPEDLLAFAEAVAAIEREACIEDVRSTGGEFAVECESTIAKRSNAALSGWPGKDETEAT